jgi:hypothetical protein
MESTMARKSTYYEIESWNDLFQIKTDSDGVIYVELDCAGDDPVAWGIEYGCVAELTSDYGPAGGAPIYRFTGTRDALESLVKNYCDGD